MHFSLDQLCWMSCSLWSCILNLMTLASHLQYAEIPLRIGHRGFRHTARARAHLQVVRLMSSYPFSDRMCIYYIYARFRLTPACESVTEAFVTLHERGLIYRCLLYALLFRLALLDVLQFMVLYTKSNDIGIPFTVC